MRTLIIGIALIFFLFMVIVVVSAVIVGDDRNYQEWQEDHCDENLALLKERHDNDEFADD